MRETLPETGQEHDGGVLLTPEGGAAPGPAGRPSRSSEVSRGFASLAAGLAVLVLGATVLSAPVPFVVGSPGPTYNTLGKTGDTDVISISGHDTYQAAGSLDLTTVYLRGGPTSDVSLASLARAWFTPSESILPVRVVYPPDVTRQQISEENAALMNASEESAVAAALAELGIAYGQQLSVGSVLEGSPSAGKLQEDDQLLSVSGQPVSSLNDIRAVLAAGKGAPAAVVIRRDGTELTETVVPAQSGERWMLGVGVEYSFTFPFDVKVELDRVGGPSAGLMFALGILDKLTAGDLTGGKHIAGTGTIGPDGQVGSIGSIRQKLHGAKDAGATLFLAPAGNCDEVVGHVPEGLAVVKVASLGEAKDAVEAYGRGTDPATLPQCTAG